jgi:hypothetical protein
MHLRLSASFFIALISILVFGSYILSAREAAAVGTAADLMCASCQMDPTKPMYCPQIPCFDVTNSFTTAGMCVMPGKCLAQSTGGGGITQLSQLMGTIGQLLQSLGQSSGGGGGSSSGTSAGCTTYTQTSVQNSTDPCSYYVPGTGSSGSDILNSTLGTGSGGSAAASELLSSLTGTSNNSNSNSNTNTATNNSSSTSGSLVPGSSNTSVIASISNPQDLKPGTSAAVSQNAFGSAPGITGDIQVLSGNRVTILASNRDTANNRQTSGFFGFTTAVEESVPTIYTQVCSAREWADTFINFIIPASYLDTLCSSHGYAVGPQKLAPASPPPASSPVPKVTTPAPQYLGAMKADIWASPSTVSSGSRSSIFWSSSGVLACSITSSDKSISASTLSGNASTLPLLKDTTFSIACQSATSSVANQVIVKVQ